MARQNELILDSGQHRVANADLRPATAISTAHPAVSPRVFYDAQAFLSPNGGTGKGIYLRNFIAPQIENLYGLSTRGSSYFEHRLIQGGFSRYHLWHQLSLPYLLRKWHADFFLAPYNTAPLLIPKQTRLILILHDLILLDRPNEPDFWQRLDNEFRRLLIPRAVARAHIVVTVSAFVKQQIQARFPSADVRLIPNTIAPSWFVGDRFKDLSERENFILTVTSDAPHKNMRRMLEAYAQLVEAMGRSTVPSLRMVGLGSAPAKYLALAQRLGIRDLVQFDPFLAEAELQALYRSAKAVLVPSLSEGFGITVLEGMASGTPVLTSNAASLPEVAGPAAAYFDPTDVNSMVAAMLSVLQSEERQQTMIHSGLDQANRFHPDLVGKQIRAFWDELLNR